jgi:N-acetylmuramoyl-L-alanine amidase
MLAMASQIGGAVSEDGLVSEEEINLKIVLKTQELLEESGSTVILTRSDENGIYDLDEKSIKNKKVSDLKNRVEIANTLDADIFVSVHLNKLDLEDVHGWQTFYQKNSEESKSLAGLIQNNLNYSVQEENKREILPLTNKYIMDNSKIPTVTVECGFLSNAREASLLQEEEYQEKIAWGIFLRNTRLFFRR